MKYLIFDFNGTIVDDVELSVEAINYCLKKYLNKNPITIDEYRHVFTFPVKKYYENVGFDFNVLDWETIGSDWMNYYVANKDTCKLYDGVKDILINNRNKGNKNILLSASKKEMLVEYLNDLGIKELFDEILGIDNIYATGKTDIALNFIKDKNPLDCLMIGDSLHDLEVAKEMHVKCALIAKGHQSKEILLKECDNVYDDIRELNL